MLCTGKIVLQFVFRITQGNAHNEGVYRCSATVQSGTVDKDYILNVGGM